MYSLCLMLIFALGSIVMLGGSQLYEREHAGGRKAVCGKTCIVGGALACLLAIYLAPLL